ncbi:ribosomal-processing cysteine protease Prp [Rossellomorea sp. KS-H15a]|jgi:uncharacterized protein|uniref:ribosomal-processing cysteine protease Prp n=1 Tax=Rossellomorea sp. KS-H15a TaxID=2963940 RepID=UPI0020C6B6BC|nr:ribosomal-processing cysteine protease Prp [Rossellomorea sp. KS-H15a]UTE78657.1 ribosomal-processing cysteine protease Prp [Rossellomorea sp. KS-H15a]
MITIKFKQHDDGIRGFSISGHALFSNHGEDIVCASVSVLALGTINSIIRICEKQPDIKEGDGFLEMSLPGSIRKSIEAQTLLKSMLYNLQDIEDQYPDHVCVCIKAK